MSAGTRALTSATQQVDNARHAYKLQPTAENRAKLKRLEFILQAVAEKLAREADKK